MNPRSRSLCLSFCFLILLPYQVSRSHDIPRQRVDRTIQLIVHPARLTVEYSLELDDTTVAADLRRISNLTQLPPDPDEWLDTYGKLLAPRLAQAFRLEFDGQEVESSWTLQRVRRSREVHPVYEFVYEVPLKSSGDYRFIDLNFGTSEGLSRLGMRFDPNCSVTSRSDYPKSAAQTDYQPVWMLDKEALEKTRSWAGNISWAVDAETSTTHVVADTSYEIRSQSPPNSGSRFSRFTIIGAFLLGLWHTLTPGHGKTLIAAVAASQSSQPFAKTKLIIGWALSHFLVIFILTVAALFLPMKIVSSFSGSLSMLAGCMIAAPAAYRLGTTIRNKLGSGPEKSAISTQPGKPDYSGFRSGLTAGLLPCWEAVGLMLLGLSAGYPIVALKLVLAFMAGGVCFMTTLVFLTEFLKKRISISNSIGYVFFIGFDVFVIFAGLQILFRSP